MPAGDYLWPAFWMLPTDNVYGTWAASGEIDIFEVPYSRLLFCLLHILAPDLTNCMLTTAKLFLEILYYFCEVAALREV